VDSLAFVWEAAAVGEASSAVLRVTVTRTPECHLFRLITSDTPFNTLVFLYRYLYRIGHIFAGILMYRSIGRIPILVVHYIKLIKALHS